MRYKLQSSQAVYAPGIIYWAIDKAKLKSDAPKICALVAATWKLPVSAAEQLVLGLVPFELEGEDKNESVVFEVN